MNLFCECLIEKTFKMKFVACLAIVAYVSIFHVNCRSVQLDIDTLSGSEVREDKDLIHDSENSGIFSWIRLKPILRREIQRIRNVKGTEPNKVSKESTETTTSIQLKKNENFSGDNLNAEKNKDFSSKDKTGMTSTNFVMSDSANNSSQNEETIESDVEEEFASNKTHDEISTTSNIPDSSVSDIQNQTEMTSSSFANPELTNNQNAEITEPDVEELFVSNMTHDQMPQLEQHLTTNDFPDTTFQNVLNQAEMAKPTFVNYELINNSSNNEEEINESDVEEKFTFNMPFNEITHFDDSLTSNFPEKVISEILNQTADSILFQVLNDNGSTIDSFDFDETSVLSQGGHIATLQEVSTIGFELLIDSETRQNLLLTELLNSQSDLIDDFTDEDDSDFTTLELDHINESEEDETITNKEESFPDVTDLDTDEDDSDFVTLKEFNHNSEEVTDFNNNETVSDEFNTHEIESDENELELSDIVQNINGMEQSSTEPEHPMCPDPGWCVFWFLALDTCAKDSHCHGSLICCTIGCSKTCIDADR